jgi:periplasmic protein TonB
VRFSVVYGVSIAIHLGVGGVVWSLKKPVARERVAVTIREVKKAPQKPPAPETPPPVKKTPPRKVATASAKPAPAPARAAAPTPAAAAAPPAADFGLMMASGGDGPALPVPTSDRHVAKKEDAPRPRPKVLAAAPPEQGDDGCPDAPVKPKPVTVLQPAYTDDARAAQIEGKVRVEITVGPDGVVTSVRVIQGLGHGLDEAALEAAKGSTFEAGSKCGKPIAMTFTIGMRFSL